MAESSDRMELRVFAARGRPVPKVDRVNLAAGDELVVLAASVAEVEVKVLSKGEDKPFVRSAIQHRDKLFEAMSAREAELRSAVWQFITEEYPIGTAAEADAAADRLRVVAGIPSDYHVDDRC